MTKDTHIAVALATAAVIMTATHNPTPREIVYGSLAAVVAGPLADADILDNAATRKGSSVLLSVIQFSLLPVFFYLYYQVFLMNGIRFSKINNIPSGTPWKQIIEISLKRLPANTSETYWRLTSIIKTISKSFSFNYVTYLRTIGLWLIAVLIIVKCGHRMYSHSIACCSAMTALWYYMIPYNYAAVWFFLAYLSHIGIDLLNGTGEQLFWPAQKKICFGICKADGLLNKSLKYIGQIVYLITVMTYLK